MAGAGNARVVAALSRLLADSYTLYLKSHNYHWNVTGPMFTTLHVLFEQQYTELAMAIDEIAERIRTLGARAPASFSEFASLAKVQEDTSSPVAAVMVQTLVADQQTVVLAARAVIKAGDASGDQATVDLATRRTEVHQKNAWMLRSHLE
ncbi:MAG TPA: DNA starvation/stationary phase protection protein [Vicinamibacterales bacterium]|nr:DNA starvation/stationary phase protection protein [Vicinamibacterales bacterium]